MAGSVKCASGCGCAKHDMPECMPGCRCGRHLVREKVQTDMMHLRIEPGLRAAVVLIAVAKDRTVAWVVRDALKRYVQDEQSTD